MVDGTNQCAQLSEEFFEFIESSYIESIIAYYKDDFLLGKNKFSYPCMQITRIQVTVVKVL